MAKEYNTTIYKMIFRLYRPATDSHLVFVTSLDESSLNPDKVCASMETCKSVEREYKPSGFRLIGTQQFLPEVQGWRSSRDSALRVIDYNDTGELDEHVDLGG